MAPKQQKYVKVGFDKKQDLAKGDPAIKSLIGELNSAFLHQRHDEAIEICQKIIELNDQVLDPYEKLSIIYENRGDRARLFKVKQIAAHLKQTDSEAWLELARMAADGTVGTL